MLSKRLSASTCNRRLLLRLPGSCGGIGATAAKLFREPQDGLRGELGNDLVGRAVDHSEGRKTRFTINYVSQFIVGA